MENEADKDAKSTLEESLWFGCIWGIRKFLDYKIQNKYQIEEEEEEEDLAIPDKIYDEDKPEFKKALVSSLKARLNWLRNRADEGGVHMFMSTTAEEKEYWLFVADTCQNLELLDTNGTKKFRRKILDVYDLNGFITALQWLGCVLSVPCTLFLSLLSEKVRLRIQDPTTSRIFYRLQDSKDDLLSPFEIIAKNNNKDSKPLQSGNDKSERTD